MTAASLQSLEFLPYLTSTGQLPNWLEGKLGIYAIFDADRQLQYIGYSRDVGLSLKQHLVRCPQQCHWLKFQAVDRLSRTALEEIRSAWLAEQPQLPPGNDTEAALWNQAIDAKPKMTAAEQAAYSAGDELQKIKVLKQVARRVESEILATLVDRGAQIDLRFDPKLKEAGLLNLK